MADIHIRPIQPGDPQSLTDAFRAQGWDKPLSLYERYLMEHEAEARYVFIALCDSDLAGYVTVKWRSRDPLLKRRGIPEIVDLNTLIVHRGKGVGAALMDAAEDLVRGRGFPTVGLGVGLYSDYGVAQRMYVKRGYLFDGRGMLQNGRVVPPGVEFILDDSVTLGMTKALRPPRAVTVVDYQPEWASEFTRIRDALAVALKPVPVDIQHVGSTSVPGLAAKPILDIDIIVENEDDKRQALHRLTAIGYTHRGDLGVTGREAFHRAGDHVPVHRAQIHHLYLCLRGIDSVENHLRLRDYLLAHPEAVDEYGELKKRLAATHSEDIAAYVEGKTKFITGVLALCGMDGDALAEISRQNRKDTL